jgi:hypothetical protein
LFQSKHLSELVEAAAEASVQLGDRLPAALLLERPTQVEADVPQADGRPVLGS